MNQDIEVNGVFLSSAALKTLKFIQDEDHDSIEYHEKHLINLDKILFQIGNDEHLSLSKSDIFDLLNSNHSLREDLNNLKRTNNKRKEAHND